MSLSKETKRISRNLKRRLDRFARSVSQECGYEENIMKPGMIQADIAGYIEDEFERLIRNQRPGPERENSKPAAEARAMNEL